MSQTWKSYSGIKTVSFLKHGKKLSWDFLCMIISPSSHVIYFTSFSYKSNANNLMTSRGRTRQERCFISSLFHESRSTNRQIFSYMQLSYSLPCHYCIANEVSNFSDCRTDNYQEVDSNALLIKRFFGRATYRYLLCYQVIKLTQQL